MRFAFGWQHDIGHMPSTTYTESAQPIPTIPQGDSKYSDISNTIMNNPDFFDIITPIIVNRFEELLSAHPNRPLVNSICHGFWTGFWPFSDPEDPCCQPTGVVKQQAGAPDLDEESTTFLHTQRDLEINLRHYSRAFGISLLPGMTSQPLFTVPKRGSTKLPFPQFSHTC